MEWLLYTCIGYSLGLASALVAVAVGQRLRENRQLVEMDEIIESMRESALKLRENQETIEESVK